MQIFMDARDVYYYPGVIIVYTQSYGYMCAILASCCSDPGLVPFGCWTIEKMYIIPLSLDILSMIDHHRVAIEPNIISYILTDTMQNFDVCHVKPTT